LILFFERVMENIDVNSPKATEFVKQRLQPIKDLPWGEMKLVPSTVKTYFRPEHLFDAINAL